MEKVTPEEKRGFFRKGLDVKLPAMEVFPNQFHNYKITLSVPEYTSMCPKTGMPDFANVTLIYIPNKWCVELKSFKLYIHAYRNLGIFYENAINRILKDFVSACKPRRASIRGDFTPRGGIRSIIEAEFPSEFRSNRK